MRGFEKVKGYKGLLPTRGSKNSAGYDFYMPHDLIIQSGEIKAIDLGIKAYMPDNEFLQIHMRSSMGIKKHLMIANTTGIIDSDYYNNETNEGEIGLALFNYGDEIVHLYKGERIVQGIFLEYKTMGDDIKTTRIGGIGSTN